MLYRSGIDNINAFTELFAGKRLGLITNHTGYSSDMISTVDILKERFKLTRLYSPEHGMSGAAQAGASVENSVDPYSGIPIYSMYGGNMNSAFEDIECAVFDIQDIGVRFYTYIYTLTDAMQLCSKIGIPLIVLDRYNPLGLQKTEGTLLDEHFSSGVGRFELPSRYALTVGEFARLINAEKSFNCELYVVPCSGLTRSTDYRSANTIWIPPSPNMPTFDTALCYIGTVIFEGTNISEGRGTTKPFELIGAPWLRSCEVISELNALTLDGVKFRKADFIPTFSKHAGQLCHGIQLHITDYDSFNPFLTALHLLNIIRKNHSEFQFIGTENDIRFIDLLLGTDELRSNDFEIYSFIERHRIKIERFNQRAAKYHLYK